MRRLIPGDAKFPLIPNIPLCIRYEGAPPVEPGGGSVHESHSKYTPCKYTYQLTNSNLWSHNVVPPDANLGSYRVSYTEGISIYISSEILT